MSPNTVQAPAQEDRPEDLQAQAGFLERALESIRKRMAAFEDTPPTK